MRDFDEIDVSKIDYLYELRHACNVLGINYIAKELSVSAKRVMKLCDSDVHGSEGLKQFFKVPYNEFLKAIEKCELEDMEYWKSINKAHEKNGRLIYDLKCKREKFAGIGTNKAKRRLNKLALNNPVAKAVRLALEAEDKSISAKKYYGTYQSRIYEQKTKLILDLCNLFKEHGWKYGIQKSEIPPTSHVIYFEIPHCEQISWHFTPEKKDGNFPKYEGEWDKKINSTLDKIEVTTLMLLEKF